MGAPSQAWRRGCGAAFLIATRPVGLPATLRLRAVPPGLSAVPEPPTLLEVAGQIAAMARGSSRGSRQIDEPFPIRDIQFDDP